MKKIVLAEKPSVGRELARVLGCNIREKGYIEGNDYVVTWALGHLVELAQPAAYSERYKRWSLRDLPMLPDELKQEVIDQSKEQYEVVSGLLNRPDASELIIATDAGREGELVARWIMKLADWKGPVKRLWISSQTDAAIKEGFANLKDGDLYLDLYAAAESRAAADWYVGMNVTRALTCHYDAKLSAGRVQTPTLALMTRREDEIEQFAGKFYWTLKADFGLFSASWYNAEDSIRITSEQAANDLVAKLQDRDGKVSSLKTVDRNEQPPLAYDLTALQQDANVYLSFSAKETLDTLQKLYEVHKIVTYPRTDSRYITHDIVATIPDRLKALASTPFGPMATGYAAKGFRIDEQRFVQDLQVTDHHAVIPTEQRVDLNRLSSDERALWELIVIRFLEVLSPDYTYRTTTLEAKVEDERFVTRLTIPVEQGWRDVARVIGRRSAAPLAVDDDDPENGKNLAKLQEGDTVHVYGTKLRKQTTAAPERYTEATLLSAMEHAGRFVDDAKLKKRLGNGLGTPATRADIIEKLIQNHYVERVGKELVPTPKGREVVRLAPEQLRSPELTGRWEERLANIAEGKESGAPFIRDIKQNAADLVKQVVGSGLVFEPKFTESKTCPWCKGPMMKVMDEFEQPHYVCQRLSCSYEEMEVKKRVPVPGSAKKKVSSAPTAVSLANAVSQGTSPSAVSDKAVSVKAAPAKVAVAVKPAVAVSVKPVSARPTVAVRPAVSVPPAPGSVIPALVGDAPKKKVVLVKKPTTGVPVAGGGVSVPPVRSAVSVAPVKKEVQMSSFSLPDDQEGDEMEYTWETVVEVVRPSKLERGGRRDDGGRDRGDDRGRSFNDRGGGTRREERPWGHTGQNRYDADVSSDGGGTFADFLAASQKRKERDERKKRK
ncbi:MAG: DNA topoisomerase 3 [Sphaerochaetaceae bacterium]|nr:DNA topoisomerase 3 [Sphaerochaetaceae bacterium]